VESGRTPDEELRFLAYEGLKTRGVELTDIVRERLEFELSVIQKKGYAAYFLTVADLLRYAHDHGILTNIRGSVAGSLTTYLTGITNVNPIEYKLPFERFLNPERPSAPDIDMDFADNRRDEMIVYSRQKYGSDKVAQIGTFGTMMARGAVRDVARAMRHPHSLGDQIAKMIPMGSQGFPMTIEKALEITPELKKLYDADPDVKSIIDMAQKIEGNARHISVHAAGVVISPIPLTEVVPLQLDPKGEGRIITQYDMYAVDENNAGLMKFDFLGLKNLSQLAFAIDLVKKIDNIEIDLEKIPYDDKKTFEMLARGETEGLFQLNGSGMTRFLKELKPTRIHDINAMVALYRPGPMEVIPEYINRKNDPSLIKFEDPRMRQFLEESYGLIVYQDDLLFCTIYLAGYTWLEADKFRKAVGKKIPAEMAALKEKFIDGIIKNGQTKKFADHLWTLFEPFQAYGFNKAHAASYGRVAYQTAYMKANFPAIYMSAILTGTGGDVDEISLYVNECKRMGIPVLAPNINESYGNFTVIKKKPGDEIESAKNKTNANGPAENTANVAGDKIRFGLYSIKNFGEGIADVIIAEREKNGKFKSLEDFLNRVKDRNLNKKSLEALIKCGAMDQFGDRGEMLANVPELLEYNKEQGKTSEGQDSFFDLMSTSSNEMTSHLKLKPAPPAKPADCLVWEKELLGLYISGHPLDKYKKILESRDTNIEKVKEHGKDEANYVIAGIIEEAKEIATKKDKAVRMMFLKVADLSGSMEVVVFPKTYEQYKSILTAESCVVIKGNFSTRNGGKSLIADSVRKLA
jgi:DNA polymerase-3 subunit alpha